MARTIEDISQGIKKSFVENATLAEAYNLQAGLTFDEQFSALSIEAALIFIVSSAIWALESLWDIFRSDTEKHIEESYTTSIPWYYQKALEFQLGDDLIFDTAKYAYAYKDVDTDKRIVKYVAIREVKTENGVMFLKFYYSGENKTAIPTEHRSAFEQYIKLIGAAGMHYEFVTQDPDPIRLKLRIYYNPLLLDNTGVRLSGGGMPVKDAIESYLNTIAYGGVFYASKLVDRIQQAEGVKDVELISETWNGSTSLQRKIEAISGAFILDFHSEDIAYNVELDELE